MQQHEYYMYSHNSRFTASLTGQPYYGDRQARPFEMNTAAQHKQFHQMKAEMPSDVLQLFKANEVAFLKAPVNPKCRSLDPVTTTCKNIHAMFDVPNENLMQKEAVQTREERRLRITRQRRERNENRILQQIEEWNPFSDENVKSDPTKTLIVARLSYKTTEKSLRFEFEKYGIIKSVRIVRGKDGDSRGYGFVEFDILDDFVAAYKSANHRKIDGSKIIVDYQRSRTVLTWRPRRFGGGKGYLRLTREEVERLDKLEHEKRRQKELDERERERSRSQKRREERRRNSKDRGDKKQRKDKKERKDKKQKKDKYED